MNDIIDQLEIGKEDLKRGGKGWFKRKWKPIKNGTWNLYTIKNYSMKNIGFLVSFGKNGGSWGKSYRMFSIRIDLIWIEINFWIRWGIIATSMVPKLFRRTPNS